MKKLFFIITAAALAGGSFFCAKKFKDGFAGDHAFRVVGYGKAGERNSSNRIMAQKFACQAALMDAQANAIFKLADAGLENVKRKVEADEYKDSLAKSFSGIIKGGSVVDQIFDEKSGECYVLYEFSEENLRAKVIRLDKK